MLKIIITFVDCFSLIKGKKKTSLLITSNSISYIFYNYKISCTVSLIHFLISFIQLVKLHSETAKSIGTCMSRHFDPDTAFWKAAITDSLATNLRHCDKGISATVSRMLIGTVEECIRLSEARKITPAIAYPASTSVPVSASATPAITSTAPSGSAAPPTTATALARLPSPNQQVPGFYPALLTPEQWQYMVMYSHRFPAPPGQPFQHASPPTTRTMPPAGSSTPIPTIAPSLLNYSFDRWSPSPAVTLQPDKDTSL